MRYARVANLGNSINLLLIHMARPKSRPVVIIVSAHVRPSPLFTKQTNFKQKNVRYWRDLWVRPSGSLMTPVLYLFPAKNSIAIWRSEWEKWTKATLSIVGNAARWENM